MLNMRLWPNEKTGKAWDQSCDDNADIDGDDGVDRLTMVTGEGGGDDDDEGREGGREGVSSDPFHTVLGVSQFTLYGAMKGNKPDFHVAMPPPLAKPFYEALVERAAAAYARERVWGWASFWGGIDGIFGAMMKVHLVNDGPVTLQLDSKKD
eukprot:jgi/Mesen1/5799/ME000293S04955